MTKKRKPILAMIGMLIVIAGLCTGVISDSLTISAMLFVFGVGLVIYAMITGQINLFGS